MRALLLAGLLALGACSVAQDTADQLAQDRAKTTINRVVADKFPGVDASPITDCIVEAASAQEILKIAGSGVIGTTTGIPNLVLDIAARPATLECIAQAQVAALL